MTAAELSVFCREHEVKIFFRHDFIKDAYIIKMRKGRYCSTRAITADLAASLGFGLVERVILREMAAELDRTIEKDAMPV